MTRGHTTSLMIVALLASACGRPSPTGPDLAQAAKEVAIDLPARLLVGASARAVISASPTPTAVSRDGAGQLGSWTSSAPQVAAVNTDGMVTGLTPGEAVIAYEQAGLRGRSTVRVLPDYGGTWVGTYTVAGCVGGADCGRWYLQALPIRFQFTQDADTVVGTVAFGSVTSDPFTASITLDGRLIAQATTTVGPASVSADLLGLLSVTPGRLQGGFARHLATTLPDGTVETLTMSCPLDTAIRTAEPGRHP